MAQQQVTISTFLELKDNLTPGLSKAAGQLNSITSAANNATMALNRMGTSATKVQAHFNKLKLPAPTTKGLKDSINMLNAATKAANKLQIALQNIKPPQTGPVPMPPLPPPQPGGGGGLSLIHI